MGSDMRRRHVIGDYYERFDSLFNILVISSNGSYLIFDKFDNEQILFEPDNDPLFIPNDWQPIT